jgi:hypothetical protein
MLLVKCPRGAHCSPLLAYTNRFTVDTSKTYKLGKRTCINSDIIINLIYCIILNTNITNSVKVTAHAKLELESRAKWSLFSFY